MICMYSKMGECEGELMLVQVTRTSADLGRIEKGPVCVQHRVSLGHQGCGIDSLVEGEGWAQCTQCGWGEKTTLSEESADPQDGRGCPSCNVGPVKVTFKEKTMETKRMRVLTFDEVQSDGLTFTRKAIEGAVERGGWEEAIGFNFDPTSPTVAMVKSLSIQDDGLYADVELNDDAIQKVTDGWELKLTADYSPSGGPVTWCDIKELALERPVSYSIGGHVRDQGESPEAWEARMKGEVEDVGEQMHQAIVSQKAKRTLRTELEEAQAAVDRLMEEVMGLQDRAELEAALTRLDRVKAKSGEPPKPGEGKTYPGLARMLEALTQRVEALEQPKTINAAAEHLKWEPTGVVATPEEHRATMHSDRPPQRGVNEDGEVYRKRAMEWMDQEDRQRDLKAAMDAHGALGGLPSDLVGRDDPNWYWRRAGMLGRDLALETKAMREKGGIEYWYHEACKRRPQVDRLAKFIMEHVTGEPSMSDGAIDTAIRIIRNLMVELDDRNARRLDRYDDVKSLSIQTAKAKNDLDGEKLDHEQTQKVVKMLAHECDRWKEFAAELTEGLAAYVSHAVEEDPSVVPQDVMGPETFERIAQLREELIPKPAPESDDEPEDDDG